MILRYALKTCKLQLLVVGGGGGGGGWGTSQPEYEIMIVDLHQ